MLYQSDMSTTYRRYGDCFPYVNFFYKLLLLLKMSDYMYTGGKILFCWNRSKRSHEKGDLTGKAVCLVDVEPKCNKQVQRERCAFFTEQAFQ